MPVLERPNCSLNYEIWGDRGRWIVLINGHTRTLNDFRSLGKKLVGSGMRVMAFDNRGAGKSVTAVDFSMADFVSDLVALIKHAGISRTAVLGISMGGAIAQLAVVEHPELFEKLILISTVADQLDIISTGKKWGQDAQSIEEKLRTYFSPKFLESNKLLLQAMTKQVLAQVQGGEFLARSERQSKALKGFHAKDNLTKIAVPTLVMHGEVDPLMKLATAEEIAAKIPEARLEVIAEAGHLLLAESPENVFKLARDFLLA